MTTAPRRVRVVGVGLLVVALLAIAVLVLASPLFRVSTIEVEGNTRLSDDAVRALTGTAVGDNLVLLSTNDAERRLTSSPWIAHAVVERRFPDALVVRVTERRAVAIARDGASALLVAADGVVLARADGPRDLPLVGTYPHGLEPGEPLPGPLATVRVLAALSPAVRRTIETAGYSEGGVVLRFGDGSYVTYGPATDVGQKAAALEGILAWAEDRRLRIRYIDVRVPESPVLRPAGDQRAELKPELPAAP